MWSGRSLVSNFSSRRPLVSVVYFSGTDSIFGARDLVRRVLILLGEGDPASQLDHEFQRGEPKRCSIFRFFPVNLRYLAMVFVGLPVGGRGIRGQFVCDTALYRKRSPIGRDLPGVVNMEV